MTSVLVPWQEQFCFYTYYTKVFWIIRCLFFNKSSCITSLTVSLSFSKQCHFQIIRLTVIDILGSQLTFINLVGRINSVRNILIYIARDSELSFVWKIRKPRQTSLFYEGNAF